MDRSNWWGSSTAEIVCLRSGVLRELQADKLEAMAGAVSSVLSMVDRNCVAGLFAPLSGMGLAPLVVHRALLDRGALVLRFGTDNLERQLWLTESMPITLLVASEATRGYLAGRSQSLGELPFVSLGVIPGGPGIDRQEALAGVAEHARIPACLIRHGDGLYSCPGYECSVDGDGVLTLSDEGGQVAAGIRVELGDSGRFRIAGTCSRTESPVSERVVAVLVRGGVKVQDNRLELDSLGMVDLLVALEEEFSFSAPIEEIDRSLFDSVEALSAFIERMTGSVAS